MTAGNVADGSVGDALVVDVLAEPTSATEEPEIGEIKMAETPATESLDRGLADAVEPVEIYGDSSYGTAKFVETIEGAGDRETGSVILRGKRAIARRAPRSSERLAT